MASTSCCRCRTIFSVRLLAGASTLFKRFRISFSRFCVRSRLFRKARRSAVPSAGSEAPGVPSPREATSSSRALRSFRFPSSGFMAAASCSSRRRSHSATTVSSVGSPPLTLAMVTSRRYSSSMPPNSALSLSEAAGRVSSRPLRPASMAARSLSRVLKRISQRPWAVSGGCPIREASSAVSAAQAQGGWGTRAAAAYSTRARKPICSPLRKPDPVLGVIAATCPDRFAGVHGSCARCSTRQRKV